MPGPMPPINAAIAEGSQENSLQEGGSVGPEGASSSQTGPGPQASQQSVEGAPTDGEKVVLPDDVQEEQQEVKLGANGLPVLTNCHG